MRKDIFELMNKILKENLSPMLILEPDKKVLIRLVGHPFTYFQAINEPLHRPSSPREVHWSRNYRDYTIDTPDGYFLADPSEWGPEESDDDPPPTRGRKWPIGENPPDGAVIQRWRVMVIDRGDGKIKSLDFDESLFCQFGEWQDNFRDVPGGGKGPDWVLKLESRVDSIRGYAMNCERTPFSSNEIESIQEAYSKIKILDDIKKQEVSNPCMMAPSQRKPKMKPANELPIGLYVNNGSFVYVFERMVLDTDGRGNKRDPFVEFRYFHFGENKVYHMTPKLLDHVKFIPVTDKAIVKEMAEQLWTKCETAKAEYEPYSKMIDVLGGTVLGG